jgi:hypothetical protein
LSFGRANAGLTSCMVAPRCHYMPFGFGVVRFRACVSADAATDFSLAVDFGSERIREACVATFGKNRVRHQLTR